MKQTHPLSDNRLSAGRAGLRGLVPLALLLAGTVILSGCCCHYPRRAHRVRQAQLRTLQMYQAHQEAQWQLAQQQQLNQQLAMERDQALAQAQIANARTENLLSERERLHQSISQQLGGLHAPGSPLSGAANRRLQELANRYPDFEFDPATGVSRFNNNLLYDSGSDRIRPEGMAVLREFARIMNEPESRSLEILVVGHTDDVPIVRPETAARHPTNWELSAHRATTVIRALAGMGVEERRMGGAEYSMHRPTTSNSSDSSRQLNRRVEIFVLAPQASLSANALFEPGR